VRRGEDGTSWAALTGVQQSLSVAWLAVAASGQRVAGPLPPAA
jgi:hypothetical protein